MTWHGRSVQRKPHQAPSSCGASMASRLGKSNVWVAGKVHLFIKLEVEQCFIKVVLSTEVRASGFLNMCPANKDCGYTITFCLEGRLQHFLLLHDFLHIIISHSIYYALYSMGLQQIHMHGPYQIIFLT